MAKDKYPSPSSAIQILLGDEWVILLVYIPVLVLVDYLRGGLTFLSFCLVCIIWLSLCLAYRLKERSVDEQTN